MATSLAAQAIFPYAPEDERARRVLSKLRQAPRLIEEIVVVQAHPEVADLMLGEERETLDAEELKALCKSLRALCHMHYASLMFLSTSDRPR